jgi:hypothetical protein
MKTILVNVDNNTGPILLGRVGEQNARQIVFDCAPFEKLYGSGTAELTAQLSNGTKYPVVTEQTETVVVWTVSDADVGVPGLGRAELSWIVGDTIAKTQVFTTSVARSLSGTGSDTPPDPYKDWVDNVEEIGRQASEDAATATQAASLVLDTKSKVDKILSLGPFLVFAEEGQ